MGTHYSHISLCERRRIGEMLEARMPVPLIAKSLGRHRSTVHREISRNFYHTSLYGGFVVKGHAMAPPSRCAVGLGSGLSSRADPSPAPTRMRSPLGRTRITHPASKARVAGPFFRTAA